ncbi:unnamed protein product [Somion occarium]|uniref:Uncharacterized protein n=1 Tax=Somion occarium TaxID=3059160 RepID=A0ABP1DG38_9APHY
MVVLGAIYSYYHFSGAKKAVESAKSAHQYFQQTTQSIKEKAPKNPNEVIEFIRRVAKSQLGLIPGASSYVDSTLDTLDDLRETHGDDVNSILTDTYNEIQDILQGKDSGADLQTGMKIIIVVKQRMGELNEVARKAGKDAWGKFEEKNPQMAQVLGSRYYELREMAGRSGPETKKIFEETSQEVKDILSKGSTPDAIKQAQSLVKDKSSQIHDLAQKTSQKTWDKAVQQAGPYLEKLPEIKQLVSENASKFVAAGAARVGSSKSEGEEVLSKIKEVADKAGKEGLLRDKQKVEDLKQFIKTKAQEAEQKVNDQFAVSWEGLQEWVKSVPGGEEVSLYLFLCILLHRADHSMRYLDTRKTSGHPSLC